MNRNESKIENGKLWVKVRLTEPAVLNKQLSRLNYDTLGNLVKDLMAGKLTHVTEDQQIDIIDLHKYLKEKYHEHTGNCYLIYFEKYAHLFFGPILLKGYSN